MTLRTEGPPTENRVMNHPFDWQIAVRWYSTAHAIDPNIQKSPSFEGLRLLSSSTTLRTGRDGNRNYSEKVFSFRLIADHEGIARIGSATIVYTEAGDELEAFLHSTPTSFTIAPEPFSWSKFIQKTATNSYFQLFVLLLIIVIVIGVTMIRLKRLKKAASENVEEERRPPGEEALNDARRLRMEGNTSDFMRMLEKAVRLTFDERFPNTGYSDLNQFRDRIEAELHPVLDRFTVSCEEIKYSPVSPAPDTLDRIWDDAQRLIGED